MFQQIEQFRAKLLNWTSAGFSVLSSGLIKYKYISIYNGIRDSGLAATTSRRAINRTNMSVNNWNYGYGTPPMLRHCCVENLKNKSGHHDGPESVVDTQRIYTDILVYKFIKKKTKCLIVAGVRATTEKPNICSQLFNK